MILAITGPIASGKSTLSHAVVAELERRGRSAETIDLDIVVREVAEERARTAVVDVIVIDGDPPLDADRYVTLTIELDEALRRVRLDPTRRLSKDPVFLRRHYNEARTERGLVIDTSAVGVDDAARAIADYAE